MARTHLIGNKHGFKHGMIGTPAYISWMSMKQRCKNKNATGYDRYGGRGIKICKRWLSFPFFYEDMGDRPKGHQLDRIDNNKGYCLDNCRWVTAKVNGNNRRNNVFLEYKGQVKNITQWAEHLGMKMPTLHKRLKHYGWSIAEAIETPIKKRTKGS